MKVERRPADRGDAPGGHMPCHGLDQPQAWYYADALTQSLQPRFQMDRREQNPEALLRAVESV